MNQSTATVKHRSSRWLTYFMALVTGVLLLLALPGASRADNLTTAGPTTATPGKATKVAGAAKITVNIPYSGDANGDNSALIQWDEDGGDWITLLGSQALPHSPNPYSYEITGLDNAVTYQIRVTITDPDGGANLVQTLTGLKPYNTLLHNAVSTGSSNDKWSGNWGLADANSQYGEISCSTCHTTSTGNIKRVKETVTAANSPTHDFPGSAVEFLDARDGSAHFGDDSGARTTSNRICEVCHLATAYHRYDATTNTGGTTHYNGRDCMECHAHNNAFKANCTSCHGDTATGVMWPDSDPADSYADRAGAHLTHVEQIGNTINAAGGGPGIATLADKNASCVYCHPQPGGTNRDGAGHTDNTLNSPADVADVFNDGINLPGEGGFKYIDGSTDSDGLYNPNTKRCSNIDCHSNGDFTWTWYEDAIAPGRILDLAGSTGTQVGTVQLTWTAPHNDGDTGPVAYGYEVRYRTGGAVTDGNWADSTIAGGAPGAVRTYVDDSLNQTMTVYGLTPGTTYYFAVKAFDETMTNYAEASNSVNAVAKTDTAAPYFQGLESCLPGFSDGAVNLSWAPAEDDSEPITYNIWYNENAAVNFGAAPNFSTTGLSYQVTGLTNGNNYYFAVRAKDAVGNSDSNTKQKEAIPQQPPENEFFGHVYYADSGSMNCNSDSFSGTRYGTLRTDGFNCGTNRVELSNITSNTTIFEWVTSAAFTDDKVIQGSNFTIYVRERSGNTDQTIQAALGHDNGTGGWVQLGASSKVIKRNFRGFVNIGLTQVAGTVPTGAKLKLRLIKTVGGSAELRIRLASDRYRSALSVYEQEANARPGAPATVNTPAPAVPAANVALSWTAATDPDGDTVYYDVYGSIDGGTSYPFIIAHGITATTATWDTVKDKVGMEAAETSCRIKVDAGDGLSHKEGGTVYDHSSAVSGTFTIDNTADITPPADITDLHAEHRPKTGTVWLYWNIPGDDGSEGKASQYDIRYKLADLNSDGDEGDANEGPIDSGAKWDASTEVTAEPVPGEPGLRQGYEVLGLNPGKKYYFAVKTADEIPNWSGLSNSPGADGGLRCGVCHSTPPDDVATKGIHKEHGFTQTDCSKCHGEEADSATTKHADGVTKIAWNNPRFGYANTAVGPTTETATSVVYKNQAGTVTIYDDNTGGGGFNDLNPGGDGVDNGTCSGFNATGVTGCHGVGTPHWGDISSVSCAMCHGDPSRSNIDPYGRAWEDQTADTKYANNAKIYKSAPGIDMLGKNGDADYTPGTEKFATGQHLRHLNFSYRFTGDQCSLCHLHNDHADGTVDVKMGAAAGEHAQYIDGVDGVSPGTCIGTSEVRCHGDNADPPEWRTRTPYMTGSKLIYCSECHGHQDHVYWQGATKAVAETGHSATVSGAQNGDGVDTTLSVNSGHTLVAGDRIMKGSTYFKITSVTATVLTLHKAMPVGINFANGEAVGTHHIPHVYDNTGSGLVVQPCTHCHTEGHPQGDETGEGRQPAGEETVFIPNYSISGIDFSSGGIHLRKVINGRSALNDGSTVDTEAEICWACHEDNGVSEWGTNTDANTGNSTYNYGSLNQTAWVSDVGGTAVWSSDNFPYKTTALTSTHTANGNPDETPAGPGVDPVAKIRCTYCHDVHDMNHAIGDTVSGKPFLRGTWKGNPYKEDGAPGRYDVNHDGTATTAENPNNYYDSLSSPTIDFGGVPRGITDPDHKMGGFWIDQNSGYPTADWTLSNSAGLCVLCHGSDVNNMNKFGNPADDWVGVNGHSNAAIGGSGTLRRNIYDPEIRTEGTTASVPGMGYQSLTVSYVRGLRDSMNPSSWNTETDDDRRAYETFSWGLDFTKTSAASGATQAEKSYNASDISYHRFSCSKCHNPHAGKLKRLMITNCLDVSHNKWDNLFTAESGWSTWSTRGVMTHSGNDVSGANRNRQYGYATSAQNCHRYVDANSDGDGTDAGEEPGWNRVTPWVESAGNWSK